MDVHCPECHTAFTSPPEELLLSRLVCPYCNCLMILPVYYDGTSDKGKLGLTCPLSQRTVDRRNRVLRWREPTGLASWLVLSVVMPIILTVPFLFRFAKMQSGYPVHVGAPPAWWWRIITPGLLWTAFLGTSFALIPRRLFPYTRRYWKYWIAAWLPLLILIDLIVLRLAPVTSLVNVPVSFVVLFLIIIHWKYTPTPDAISDGIAAAPYCDRKRLPTIVEAFLASYWDKIALIDDERLRQPPRTLDDFVLQFQLAHPLYDLTPYTDLIRDLLRPDCGLEGQPMKALELCAAELNVPAWQLRYKSFAKWCQKNQCAPISGDLFQDLRERQHGDSSSIEAWLNEESIGLDSDHIYYKWCREEGLDSGAESTRQSWKIVGDDVVSLRSRKIPDFQQYLLWCRQAQRQPVQESQFARDIDWRISRLRAHSLDEWFRSGIYLDGNLCRSYEEYAAWCERRNQYADENVRFPPMSFERRRTFAYQAWLAFRTEYSATEEDVYQKYAQWCRERRVYLMSRQTVDRALAIERDPWEMRKTTCRECGGTGRVRSNRGCRHCGGTGEVDWVRDPANDRIEYKETPDYQVIPYRVPAYKKMRGPCPECSVSSPCIFCHGTGESLQRCEIRFAESDVKDVLDPRIADSAGS